jgi:hypothetical protein
MTKDGGQRVVEEVTAGVGEGGIRGKRRFIGGGISRRRRAPEDCWI